jgi:ribonuclease BN (tRNA processing enzyme)
VLDAGTGLRRFGLSLSPRDLPGEHVVLLSHLHGDHLAGLPFFAPLYHPAAVVRVLGPDQPTASLQQVLDRLLDPAVWPMPRRSALETTAVGPGRFEAAGFVVQAGRLAHPGVTLGYRVETPSGRIVSYVTDNELAAVHPSERQELVQLVTGSDVLIHDATWPDALLADRAGWGHSSAGEAAALAADAGCRMGVLFHHDPDADDSAIDRQVEVARQRIGGGPTEVVAAADGLVLEL